MKKNKMGKVKKNISWILIQNIYTMIIGMIITGIVARHYGTEGYGIINFGTSFVSLFSFIAIFGTNHIIINDFTKNESNAGIILKTNLIVRIILSVIALIVCQTAATIMYNDSTIRLIVFLFNINTILSCSDVITYYAQSKIKNKYISICKIISFTVLSILKIIVISYNLNIIYLISTYLIETIIYSILLIFSFKKIKDKDEVIIYKFDKSYAKTLIKRSKYFALSSLMVTIYLKIDQVMLGTFFTDKSVVGIYAAAVKISELWTFVPISVITSFKPIVIECKSKNNDLAYKKNLQKLYNIVSLICFIFLIGIIIFGKLGIHIIYGKSYYEAYLPLIILTIGVWFGVLGNIHYIWMTCENKEKYSTIYSLVGCVTNIILNAILIPKYSYYGAAIATLISQTASNIIVFELIPKARIIAMMALKSLNIFNGIKELKNNNKIFKL